MSAPCVLALLGSQTAQDITDLPINHPADMSDGAIECRFPSCDADAVVPVLPTGEEGLALCPEHRTLLLDDPGQFRRLWGALDPRPRDDPPPYQPRRDRP